MTEEFPGCVYHTIEVLGPGRFKVEVFRDGYMSFADFDETGEATFFGGRKTATLYRSTEDLAHEAGITYSFVTHPGELHGTRGPKYGKRTPPESDFFADSAGVTTEIVPGIEREEI